MRRKPHEEKPLPVPTEGRDSKGRWVKGHVPNPNGMGGSAIKLGHWLKVYLRDNPDKVEELVESLVRDAIDGDPAVRAPARKLIFDRVDGANLLGDGGEGGPAIRIVFELPGGGEPPRDVTVESVDGD